MWTHRFQRLRHYRGGIGPSAASVTEVSLGRLTAVEDFNAVKAERTHWQAGLVLHGPVKELDLALSDCQERLLRGNLIGATGGPKVLLDDSARYATRETQGLYVAIPHLRRCTGSFFGER